MDTFGAFDQCSKLVSIDTSENNNFIFENNVLYNKAKTTLCFVGANATDVDIPITVTNIGDYAFRYCTQVTSINIPEKVTSIGNSVWNSNITNITVDNNNNSFKIANKGSLVSADGKNLYRCTQKETVIVDDGVVYIYAGAFLPGITSIKLPDSYRSAVSSAFPTLDELELPKDVESFDKNIYVFVKQIKVNSENTHFKMSEDNNYMTSYDGEKLYWAKSSLKELNNIPNGVNTICKHAFMYSNATNLVIPEGVTTIEEGIINGSSINTIEIPSTIKSIGGSAFLNANNLSKIIIHKTKDSISGSPWGAVGGNKIIEWKDN